MSTIKLLNIRRAVLSLTLSAFIFMTAFTVDKHLTESVFVKRALEFRDSVGMTPYEAAIDITVAREGFSSKWYPDGVVRGKQTYSIGYGYCDLGDKDRRSLVLSLMEDDTLSESNARALMKEVLFSYPRSRDPFVDVANRSVWYNRGRSSTPGSCCKSDDGCGSGNSRIRKSHNRSRNVEKALLAKDVKAIRSALKDLGVDPDSRSRKRESSKDHKKPN